APGTSCSTPRAWNAADGRRRWVARAGSARGGLGGTVGGRGGGRGEPGGGRAVGGDRPHRTTAGDPAGARLGAAGGEPAPVRRGRDVRLLRRGDRLARRGRGVAAAAAGARAAGADRLARRLADRRLRDGVERGDGRRAAAPA